MVKLRFNVAQSIMETHSMKSRNEKKIMNISFDEKTFQEGHEWYYNGFKLEDADESLRNNKNFVNGYNRAARLSNLEIHLYSLGEGFFREGLAPEEIPLAYINNEIVLKGYENAKINHRKK